LATAAESGDAAATGARDECEAELVVALAGLIRIEAPIPENMKRRDSVIALILELLNVFFI